MAAKSPLRDVLLIHWRGAGQPLDWLRIDAGGRVGSVLREPQPPASAIDSAREIIVLVPSESVTVLSAPLPARQPEQARKAAPFAVEDQIAGNVEALHFAVAPNGPGQWWVAAVQPETLRGWLQELDARGIHPDRVLPDVLALAADRDASVLLRDGDRALVRAPQRAFATDADIVDALIDPAAEVIRLEHGSAPALQQLATGVQHSAGMNLLCAPFAAQHRGADLRVRWRRIAWFAAAVVVLAFGVVKLDEMRLRHRLATLNGEMERVYREQFPQAQQVPNPFAQMKSALAAASGGAGGETTGLGLLALSAPVLTAQARVQLLGADYRAGVLSLRLAAPSIEVLDALREGLDASAGLRAQLENADTVADGIEGRIKIEAGA
jgi:general secretion pathway protein L